MRPLAVALLAILVLGTELVTALLQVSLAMSASSIAATILAAQLVEVLALPFGAMAALAAIERGGLRVALVGGAILLLVAALVVGTATDTSPVVVPVGLAVGTGTGAVLTAAFTAVVHATSVSWRSTGVAVLVVAALLVGAFSLIYTEGWILIPTAVGLVVVAVVLPTVLPPRDPVGRAPQALGRLAGLTLLLTVGIASTVAAADPRRIVYGVVLPLEDVELSDLALGRAIALAIGVVLIVISGRALFTRDGNMSVRVIACLGLLSIGGAAVLLGSSVRTSMVEPSGVSFLAGTVAIVCGAAVAAWWMRRAVSSALPAPIGGWLVAAAAVSLLLTNESEGALPLLSAAMIAAGAGMGMMLVVTRTLVADTPLDELGRLTAGSVIAISAATTIGSLLGVTFASGAGRPDPLLDVAMLVAAIGGGILLATRLPVRHVPGAEGPVDG